MSSFNLANNLRVRNNLFVLCLYGMMDYGLITGFLLWHQYLKTKIKKPSDVNEH